MLVVPQVWAQTQQGVRQAGAGGVKPSGHHRAAAQTNSKYVPHIDVVRFEDYVDRVRRNPEPLLIVNFWATWCVPCVEEIPHFISVYQEKKDDAKLGIMFVSLDHISSLEAVENFAKKQELPGTLLLLDDVKRFNEWIPQVHPEWDGTLPATGIYRRGRLLEFRPEPLTEEELNELVDKWK